MEQKILSKPVVIVDYIRKQLLNIARDPKTPVDIPHGFDVAKKISQIKKVSEHDYMVQGKMFQIIEPALDKITLITKVDKIIIKEGELK